jgi:hypothetical protein
MTPQLDIDRIDTEIGRRSFAKTALAASVGAIAAGGSGVMAQAPVTDIDLLNFTLNFDYLEAEFYTLLTSGVSISAPPFNIPVTGIGTPGPTVGLQRITFDDPVLQQAALELAYNEREHVRGLRLALGANAIAKPAIDFRPLGAATVARFLQVGRILEDVAASGIVGALPMLTVPANRVLFARALFVEGNHSLSHRMQMLQRGIADIGPVDAKDVIVAGPPRPGARLVNADLQGLAVPRTPSEILAVVYGPGAPAGTSAGLLFPNGVNGTIRTV